MANEDAMARREPRMTPRRRTAVQMTRSISHKNTGPAISNADTQVVVHRDGGPNVVRPGRDVNQRRVGYHTASNTTDAIIADSFAMSTRKTEALE